MNSQNHAQIVRHLMLLESHCASLKRFMNVQTASEHLQISTETTLSQIEMMSQQLRMMRELATVQEDGGDDDLPW